MGNEVNLGKPGDIIADRYLVVAKSVLLDRIPSLAVQAPAVEKLEFIKPYLKLIPFRLQVPQVYGLLPLRRGGVTQDVLLLENPPVFPKIDSDLEVSLREELTKAWGGATSMRQLNWLWQIANIWQPLASEGVASTLMETHLMRVEGPILRLLELRQDEDIVTLAQLGEFWRSRLLPFARNAIAEFLGEICHLLIDGEVKSGEQLILLLDRGLKKVGNSQSLKIRIATQTDTGPSRQRNEDACYPSSKGILSKPPESKAMGIVCDGIGGHEGGNVASNLAIKTIEQELQQLNRFSDEDIEPGILLGDLEKAVAVANDKISERNDNENRQGRKRMGTTLVMALPIGHELYVTHVGDSRAYWITRYGCYQVTLDDDVASREVRLGYAVYRDALKQVASGSLVQALGMSPSLSLHPTVQRFVLDEDGIFLLCSDGLSDFDRVEQHWETEILPVLSGKQDLATATNKLVEIANVENGHDNVTIALLHYKVNYSEPKSALQPELADLTTVSTAHSLPTLNTSTPSNSPNQKTKVLPDTIPLRKAKIPLTLILPILVLGGGLLGYFIMQFKLPEPWEKGKSPAPAATRSPEPELKQSTAKTLPTPNLELQVNSEFTTREKLEFSKQLPLDSAISEDNFSPVMLPEGTVLQVVSKEPLKNNGSINSVLDEHWLKLRVCSIGGNTGSDENTTSSSKGPPVAVVPEETFSPESPIVAALPEETFSPESPIVAPVPQETLSPDTSLGEAFPKETPLAEISPAETTTPSFTDDSSSIKLDEEVWIKSGKINLKSVSISKPSDLKDSNNSPCLKLNNKDIPEGKSLLENETSPTKPGESTTTQPLIIPSETQSPSQTGAPVIGNDNLTSPKSR
ncbi:PP2C family protein-serine/threonine phosphatase [Mastigocoleus testarum]|uniref:PPM-type phosphatase domain-containing protein n=1 Tax=Mastigocoleus testarum BC008 TaxID=371196 RepID=A0A0V7ZCE2_9CYAN|nr:protein phosphatase 2C domain-containing protein [Mastigocoleus testarum]KST62012.1 hypothetical protein BC008_08235 [Mastigocoleus testarum BC008]